MADNEFEGSSPRVRGKLSDARNRRCSVRLIPACAGKTVRSAFARSAGGAHPRVCGENGKYAGSPVLKSGSSPRVRGKPIHGVVCTRQAGLIPACAGKTPDARDMRLHLPAHPRVCGENTRAASPPKAVWGSSPRVRGKPTRNVTVRSRKGLIPACAGKTLPR